MNLQDIKADIRSAYNTSDIKQPLYDLLEIIEKQNIIIEEFNKKQNYVDPYTILIK